MITVIKEKRGMQITTKYLDDGTVLVTSEVPWQEVVCDMSDMISNLSSGYASFDYQDHGVKKSDLIKVEIAINGDTCDPLSFISDATKAVASGRVLVLKLKEVITRQQFEINIQAKINSKVRNFLNQVYVYIFACKRIK
jgi:GTP-binding protein LepA